MRPTRLAVLLLCAALVASALTSILYLLVASGRVVAVQEVAYRFSVDAQPGVDVGTDILRLGAVPPGSRAKRWLEVSHPSARSVRVAIEGPGAAFLSADPPSVPLRNGTARILFVAAPPIDASPGAYSGTVRITFLK